VLCKACPPLPTGSPTGGQAAVATGACQVSLKQVPGGPFTLI